jgi:hypothetical protein
MRFLNIFIELGEGWKFIEEIRVADVARIR